MLPRTLPDNLRAAAESHQLGAHTQAYGSLNATLSGAIASIMRDRRARRLPNALRSGDRQRFRI